jgi:bifunctional non-homologous end joining protein LigD
VSLRDYARKRRFNRTAEPTADIVQRDRAHTPIFVVQLHEARTRHYDFRLEVDGVLKRWAVPKGPSLRPADKRLAIRVEDHPLAYATFRGDIPPGQYGAGHVEIFDHGDYLPEGDPAENLRAGKLTFELRGKHLRGGWLLLRTHIDGDARHWLLIKHDDSHASDVEADDLVEAPKKPWLTRLGFLPLQGPSRGGPQGHRGSPLDAIEHRAFAVIWDRSRPIARRTLLFGGSHHVAKQIHLRLQPRSLQPFRSLQAPRR